MENFNNSSNFEKNIKVYQEPNEIKEKINEISEKLEIAKKQNTQRLSIPFSADEMKKLEIAFNYKYNINKRTKIASMIKDRIMKEIEEILKEMKENFFKEI